MPAGGPLLGPTATTRLAAVIGDPVRHSLSPIIHNSAYRAMGLDWVYVALPVRAGGAPAAVEAMRALGLVGLSVTMPHKHAVVPALDGMSTTAQRLGVVNTISWQGDELFGDSTDGAGLVDALRDDHGWDAEGQRCVVLGAGGAARAVCLALGQAGAGEIGIVARRHEAAATCADLAGAAGAVVSAAAVEGADLVINSTPAGMPGQPALPFDVKGEWFGRRQLVVDLVYEPRRTVLMSVAAERGAETANGLSMLIHQAARQVAAWSGRPAPVAAMADALREHESATNRGPADAG